jgi:RimJ/RimL family protein N-acetyltransferase
MRERVRAEGFRYVDIVADASNEVSRKVIEANGGFAFERFRAPDSCGGADCLRFRWYAGEPFPIARQTERLVLRQWRDSDREPFAELNADARVMAHFPAPLSRAQSDAQLDRARDGIARRGWGFWAVESRPNGGFLGFVGLGAIPQELPFAPAVEVGWRLCAGAWGAGYATEAAREALRVAFEALQLPEVVSYTAATNARSMAVMRRLGMREAEAFEHPRIRDGHPLRAHRVFRLRREDSAPSASTPTS